MIVTNELEIQKLKHIGGIVARCLLHMKEQARPGMSLLELDEIGAKFLKEVGARSAPILQYQYPGHTCLSVCPVVAHGVPSSQILQEGDLLNIDVSAEKDGFFGDNGGSFFVGKPTEEGQQLLRATREARDKAIQACRPGLSLRRIGQVIEKVAEEYGFEIIENLGSHGVGLSLHEEPTFIPHFDDPEEKRVLEINQVITIEPFLATTSQFVDEAGDGWTLLADKGGLTAQFEHTILITDKSPLILTDPRHP